MRPAERLPERPRLASADEAQALLNSVLDCLSALSHVVGEETALVRDGRLSAALTQEKRKSELAGAYMSGLETVKTNAVALARFAPDDVQRLKQAHSAFLELIETNQAVLATARAVSETIVRQLATDVSRPTRADGYGPGRAPAPPPRAASPLVLSKRL